MARYNNDSYKQRQEERRKYKGDVSYGVWRAGGNPDNIDVDEVYDAFSDHVPVEATVKSELRRQRPREVAYELEEAPQDQVCPAD